MIVLEHFATSSLLSDTSNQNIFHSLSPTTTPPPPPPSPSSSQLSSHFSFLLDPVSLLNLNLTLLLLSDATFLLLTGEWGSFLVFSIPITLCIGELFFLWLWENKNENGNGFCLACVCVMFVSTFWKKKHMILFVPFFLF